ncbi:MAG: hypothetical protein ABTD50_08275 [Polyangiaceae bacterium]|jgi:type II secretory pathway pseudopilin PulG
MIRRHSHVGFTLIELVMALTAGLIVAMGIVALSREATRTFHEEVRSAAAEATLRTAVDRLRADLQRAGFMSTANFTTDPLIARSSTGIVCSTYWAICNLAAVHVTDSGSVQQTPLSAVQTPALAPDYVDIAGNMTSVEQFEVQAVLPVTNGQNCQTILLSQSSATYARVVAGAGAGNTAAIQTDLQNMFAPDSASQFIVRLVDDTGRSQFLATCPGNPAGLQNGQPYVSVSSDTAVVTAKMTGNVGGVSGFAAGRAWVNPVQIVRWQIMPATLEPPAFQIGLGAQSLGGAVDPNKYDLVRWYLGMNGSGIANTMEVVAEYAVDLDFAFSFEMGTAAAPASQTYWFEDTVHKTDWVEWSNTGTQGVPATAIPQRLRSVRVRLATRVAQADRSVNIPANAGNFIYRYCLNTAGCPSPGDPNAPMWARTRTITTEVSLPNLATEFYP